MYAIPSSSANKPTKYDHKTHIGINLFDYKLQVYSPAVKKKEVCAYESKRTRERERENVCVSVCMQAFTYVCISIIASIL